MRDPDRIDEVLDKLETYWKEHPDLRLGQIVSNANAEMRSRILAEHVDGPRYADDPFHLEDETLLGYFEMKNRRDGRR